MSAPRDVDVATILESTYSAAVKYQYTCLQIAEVVVNVKTFLIFTFPNPNDQVRLYSTLSSGPDSTIRVLHTEGHASGIVRLGWMQELHTALQSIIEDTVNLQPTTRVPIDGYIEKLMLVRREFGERGNAFVHTMTGAFDRTIVKGFSTRAYASYARLEKFYAELFGRAQYSPEDDWVQLLNAKQYTYGTLQIKVRALLAELDQAPKSAQQIFDECLPVTESLIKSNVHQFNMRRECIKIACKAKDAITLDEFTAKFMQPPLSICSECGLVPEAPMMCGQCKAVVFCSRDCQRSCYKRDGHEGLCQSVQKVLKMMPIVPNGV